MPKRRLGARTPLFFLKGERHERGKGRDEERVSRSIGAKVVARAKHPPPSPPVLLSDGNSSSKQRARTYARTCRNEGRKSPRGESGRRVGDKFSTERSVDDLERYREESKNSRGTRQMGTSTRRGGWSHVLDCTSNPAVGRHSIFNNTGRIFNLHL